MINMSTQTYQPSKQLSNEEKESCNTLQKDYDDTFVRNKVLTWWNKNNPTNTVKENDNIYGIDLIGVENPNFAIEVERSLSWNSHQRPQTFKTVRIPIRKAGYWLPKDSEAIFVQINKEATACVLLRNITIREEFYNRIIKTSVGYKEHFLEYYTWEYFEL
jgi:hypothetical protein